MLHARLEVAQILDMFQVRAVITEFAPGQDPVTWQSEPRTYVLDEEMADQDPLSIIIHLISVWSEMTNPK